MKKLFRFLSIAMIALVFTQCQKEVSHVGGPDPIPGTPTLPSPITSTVQGNVFDENNTPEAGVTVKVGSQTAITDAKGYFRIKAASLDQNTSLVTAEKSGYHKGIRVFSATAGTNHVEIKLIPKTLTGTINGSTGGEVSLSNGSKVALKPNGVVVASSGAAYTGTVNVYASYIDPTSNEISRIVPGSFQANDKNGNRVILASYGMIAVELESATGEKLQIKQGSTATLTTAIPSSLQGNAPATIASWSVDETTGLWKEETTATKTGNVYIGEVSHFSFWNCDVSLNSVKITMQVKDPAGQPLVHIYVKIKRVSTGQVSGGYTDSLGHVSGWVPGGEQLELSILNACHVPIHTQNIGPFTSNTNLGVITVTNTGSSVTTVTGTLLKCNGQPVTHGFAVINYGNMTIYAAVNAQGQFHKNIVTCPTSGPTAIHVVGVDSTGAQQSSTPATATIAYPTTNVGNVSACGTSTVQFINYTLDGTSYVISSAANDSLVAWNGSGTTMTMFMGNANIGQTNNIAFGISSAINAPGVYPITTIKVGSFQQGNAIIQPGSNVTLTVFPLPGQYYEGSFSGSFTNASQTHTVSGTFRVRRNP